MTKKILKMKANLQQVPASCEMQDDNSHNINKSLLNRIAKFYNNSVIVIFLLLISGNTLSAVIDDIKADMQLNEASLLNAPTGPGCANSI